MRTVYLILALLTAGQAFAQIQLTGTVTDDRGEPLPAATVRQKNGTAAALSNLLGNYQITVPPGAEIIFSMVGFAPIEAKAPAESGRLDVRLREGIELKEALVTALGIEREAKQLAYSATKVNGENFGTARETNVANSLAGRVAGLSVSGLATGPGGSARLVIRGYHSISRDNQPLYVVDGLPIDNSILGPLPDRWGGRDWGDGISSISPDDIAELTVLKGATAAALYGSRASNGVILITTKRGQAGKNIAVELNSNLTFETPLNHQDYQRNFGQGWIVSKPGNAGDALNNNWFNYGAAFDSTQAVQFDGVTRPWAAAGDHFKDFYKTGQTFTNSLALSGGSEAVQYRFGFTNLDNQGVVPNSSLERRTFTLGLTTAAVHQFSASANIRYIDEASHNRSNLSGLAANPNVSIAVLPANVPLDAVRGQNGDGSTPDGQKELRVVDWNYITNAYWACYRMRNDDRKDRLIASVELRFDPKKWVYALARAGRDGFISRRTEVAPVGTAYVLGGSMSEQTFQNRETNLDLLAGSRHSFANGLGYDAFLGANRRDGDFENIGIGGQNFEIPGLEAVNNLKDKSNWYGRWRRRTNSVFGSVNLAWQSWLYGNFTGRQDWFSTLPKESNSLFFPSAGVSFVFSEKWKMPSWLDFGKLRFSWAQVSGDVDPYSLSLNYALTGSGHLGQPLGAISNTVIPDAALAPALSEELETGLDLRFFHNRLGLDLAVYQQHTRRDIVVSNISPASGFEQRFVRDGEIRNRGIEVLLRGTPLRRGDWSWETSLNFAYNQNRVEYLGAGVESIQLALSSNDVPTAFIHNEVGQPASVLKGFAYKRDAAGNIVHDAQGVPLRGELVVFGPGVHPFTGGWANTLRWRSLTLDFLIDFKTGAKLFSGSNAFSTLIGKNKTTLQGRDGDPTDPTTWYTSPGVNEAGEPNTVAVHPLYSIGFWSVYPGRVAEPFVHDASFAKLRQVTLTWRLPQNWTGRARLHEVDVSLTGRNLLLLFSKVPNQDPESNFVNGNAQGIEMFSVPVVRSFGVNLRVKI